MPQHFLNDRMLGKPAEADPYLTFSAARETGILKNPQELAVPARQALGVDIANGLIPNSKGAGIVDLRDGLLVAFDHASIEEAGNELHIYPAAKHDVSHEGHVQQEGAIIMAGQDERIKLVAVTVDTIKNPWLADRLNTNGSRLGRMATFAFGIDAPGYEIYDIDLSSGIIKAKPSRKIIRF